jgi:hypothetical protein
MSELGNCRSMLNVLVANSNANVECAAKSVMLLKL